VAQAAAEEGISKATYCRWSKRLNDGGADALKDRISTPHWIWNRIVPVVEKAMLDCALECPELSPRELAVRFSDEFSGGTASESSFYRLLKENNLVKSPVYVVHIAEKQFRDKTTQPNELWQTDLTALKLANSSWCQLSTVPDDNSRYIVAWTLSRTGTASDVAETVEKALQASGCDQAPPTGKPRLLSDNGSCYISGDLAKWLRGRHIEHSRGALYRPQTQGKIERWRQTMKKQILLDNYANPTDLERQIGIFVERYNNARLHESLQNLTPADVYFGRGQKILDRRAERKRLTMQRRRELHSKGVHNPTIEMRQIASWRKADLVSKVLKTHTAARTRCACRWRWGPPPGARSACWRSRRPRAKPCATSGTPPSGDSAMAGARKFVELFGDCYPKATKCLLDDLPELLAFFDYPAAHWVSIRTTNPIESAFSTIRNRTKLTRGAMNRQGTVAMVFKLGTEAQKRWRRINGFSQLANVYAFFPYKDGRLARLENQPEAPVEPQVA